MSLTSPALAVWILTPSAAWKALTSVIQRASLPLSLFCAISLPTVGLKRFLVFKNSYRAAANVAYFNPKQSDARNLIGFISLI